MVVNRRLAYPIFSYTGFYFIYKLARFFLAEFHKQSLLTNTARSLGSILVFLFQLTQNIRNGRKKIAGPDSVRSGGKGKKEEERARARGKGWVSFLSLSPP